MAKKKLPTTLAELAAMTPEDDVQEGIVAYLRSRGAIVLQTNLAKRHPTCDKGVPDLIVTRPSWPIGAWCGIEIKDADGKLTAEQQNLLKQGRIYVARTPDEAYDAVKSYVRDMTMWTDGFSAPRRSINGFQFTDLILGIIAYYSRNRTLSSAGFHDFIRSALDKIGVDVKP